MEECKNCQSLSSRLKEAEKELADLKSTSIPAVEVYPLDQELTEDNEENVDLKDRLSQAEEIILHNAQSGVLVRTMEQSDIEQIVRGFNVSETGAKLIAEAIARRMKG
jgi:hypothetical protein